MEFSEINIKNAIITENSVVLQKLKPVKNSVVRDEAWEKYQKPGFLLKYIFPTLSFSNKDDVILITDEWSKNYCHFLWESLSKLIVLKQNHPKAKLAFCRKYLKIDFMMKALEAFGFKDSDLLLINKSSHLKVKNLNFIGCINIGTHGYYDFLKFSEIRDKIIAYFSGSLTTNYGQRIYISREDPQKNTARKIHNSVQIQDLLAKYGFKTVYMENHSFLEQVSIAKNAKIIISPHGAGITNAMFMMDNSTMIEIVNYKWAKTCFAEMFERMKINYIRQDAKPANNKDSLHLVDIIVDISKLEETLINLKL